MKYFNTASQTSKRLNCEKTGLRGFRPGPTQNRAVQSQNIVRGLKFRI